MKIVFPLFHASLCFFTILSMIVILLCHISVPRLRGCILGCAADTLRCVNNAPTKSFSQGIFGISDERERERKKVENGPLANTFSEL